MISLCLKSILPTIGRIILSLSVLMAGWGILYLLAVFPVYLNRETSSNDKKSLAAEPQITSIATSPKRSSLWPQYPVHGSIAANELILNGIPITIEEWDSSTPPRSILDYYETQMTARGWRDSMKEIRSLVESSALRLQNDKGVVAAAASQIVQGVQPDGSMSLELQRPGWSMSIVVEPSGKSINQSRVTITAAQVVSLDQLTSSIAAASKPAAFGNENKPLDIVRNLNGTRYHTTIASSKEGPVQALKKFLADLGSKGWHLTLSPFRQGSSDYFAWLVRGKEYATLSVKAASRGENCSVNFTEVTPN